MSFRCCYGCKDRDPYCHSDCERYLKEKSILDAKNKKERDKRQADNYLSSVISEKDTARMRKKNHKT